VLGAFAGCLLVVFGSLQTPSGREVIRRVAEFRGPPFVSLTGTWRRADGSANAGFTFSDKSGALLGTATVPGGKVRIHGFRDGPRAWIVFDGSPPNAPRFNFVLVAIDSALLQVRRQNTAGGWEQSDVSFVRDTTRTSFFGHRAEGH
jgi:hypothetical protein